MSMTLVARDGPGYPGPPPRAVTLLGERSAAEPTEPVCDGDKYKR